MPGNAASSIGQTSTRDRVAPRQRLLGNVVEPSPQDEQHVTEHLRGGLWVASPKEEPPDRVVDCAHERAEAQLISAIALWDSPHAWLLSGIPHGLSSRMPSRDLSVVALGAQPLGQT
jgi:hypothetical protein